MKRLPQTSLPTKLHLLASEKFYYDDDDDDVGSDLDLHRGYSRPRLVSNDHDENDQDYDDISDHVKIRLLIARLRALEKYKIAT